MQVQRVNLKNFLSYGMADVRFGPNLNVIVGENAVGKTNLLDSIYLSALGKCSRNQKDKDLIKWETKDVTQVSLRVIKKHTAHTITTVISNSGDKNIYIDGIPIKRVGELMGTLNIVFFSPDEIGFIKNGPSERRRFLDISLCQQNKTYFYTLQNYQRKLEQRNKVLKDYKNSSSIEAVLNAIDTIMIEDAIYIIREREKFIRSLTPYAIEAHNTLTGEKETFKMAYETDCSTSNIDEEFKRLFKESTQRDIALGYTNIGPHRDDINILANNIDLRKFGSQGQKRTAVLSLKMAELELFKEKHKESPVVLLDDVLSELDDNRKEALFKAVQGAQIILTDTEIPKQSPKDTMIFRIKSHTNDGVKNSQAAKNGEANER